MGLLTATAGWLPKPRAVKLARWRHAEGEIDAAALRAAERDATRDAIELQRRLGLDTLVDPQMSRGDLVGDFGGALDGLDTGGLVRCWGNHYYRRPRIVGELRWRSPLTVDGWRVARDAADAPVRAVLAGPYTLMDWSFDEHYRSRSDACRAFADVVASEATALVEAGADELELAEPAAGVRNDELSLLADVVGRVRSAVDGRARCWVRIGLGDPAVDLAPLLELPADGLLLALANAGDRAADALGALPGDRPLAAGVVDVHDPRVESVDEIRARIELVRKRVSDDRLTIVPDGGMTALEPQVAEAKLRAMVEAAAAC